MWGGGMSGLEIMEALHFVKSAAYVSKIVQCSLGQDFLENVVYKELNHEVKRMRVKALGVCDRLMKNFDPKVELAAVAVFSKLVPPEKVVAETAEDSIAEIMQDEEKQIETGNKPTNLLDYKKTGVTIVQTSKSSDRKTIPNS